VTAQDGQTYEEAAIRAWLAAKGLISPRTGLPLESDTLVPNVQLQQAIAAYMAGP
jgi:hypothetical protein